MSQKPHSNDPAQPELPAGDKRGEDSGMKSARRKLRYDAPVLDIPRPLYLRTGDHPSDEDAA